MAESYQGITVPDGHPGSVREAAHSFRTAGHGLQGTAGDIRGVPALAGDWQGPASATFHGSTVTNGGAVDQAVDAMLSCAHAAHTYADELQRCQHEARRAIAAARDAQHRIDQAEGLIAAARQSRADAYGAMDAANTRIAVAAAHGGPAVAAHDDLAQASATASGAEQTISTQGGLLDAAQADLADAKRRGEAAEQDARHAARAAAGAFDGIAGGSPIAAVFGGPPSAVGPRILAAVRAGDFHALDGVPLNYLPPRIQREIGGVLADKARAAAADPTNDDFDDIVRVIDEHQHDEELAVGFYNRLGGEGTQDLIRNTRGIRFFGGNDEDGLEHAFGAFAGLLGTATRSPGLRGDFAEGFVGARDKAGDRIGTYDVPIAFLMTQPASSYGAGFLTRFARDVLVDSEDRVLTEGSPNLPWSLADHQEFMKYVAGNPEAAGLLLSGKHADGHVLNAGGLMIGNYDDGGDALAALIEAGTHGNSHADQAAQAVIQAAGSNPGHDLPPGIDDALVQILDDHAGDLMSVAAHEALPNAASSAALPGLDYDHAEGFLQRMVANEATRDRAAQIIADQVAAEIAAAAATTNNLQHTINAGALAQMNLQATAGARMDAAEARDLQNKIASLAAEKVSKLALDRVTGGVTTQQGISDAANQGLHKAFGQLFPQDGVEKALQKTFEAQVDGMQGVQHAIVAAQVQAGDLPPQALDMFDPNGNMLPDFIDNGAPLGHDILVDSSGRPVAVDLNHDGHIGAGEHRVTEYDLYKSTNDVTGPAEGAMTTLWDEHKDEFGK